MKRLILAVAAAAIALMPITAASSPSPTPSLDSILLKPPSADFVELTTATLHGEFTSHDWATNANSTETETTLNHDGFIDGFGMTWASSSSGHALIEAVMAFSGGSGAKSALTSLETSDRSDPNYTHGDSVSGISPYYGVHYVDKANGTYEDLFGFVKGNDLFLILFASGKDDVFTLATTQAKSQFDSAPASTIPSSQWPENASPSGGFAYNLGEIFGGVILLAVLVGVVLFVVGLVRRSRRGTAAMAGAYGMPAAPGAVGTPVAGGAVQMSPDGNYWWDGQGWKDAALEAPPAAQRSSDGTLWWDGQKWRPVGQAPPESPPAWPS